VLEEDTYQMVKETRRNRFKEIIKR
jgi:hypothetical protein